MVRYGFPLLALLGFVLVYGSYSLAKRAPVGRSHKIETGVASWYGSEEQGKPTANGERFDRHAFTAASRDIPLDTLVRVTNSANGRSVQVRINDRGPFVKGRILDVSEAAASALEMKTSGTAPVKIVVVEDSSGEASSAP